MPRHKSHRRKKQRGGTRKLTIRTLPTLPIYNVRRTTPIIALAPKKPYNHLRGQAVNVIGEKNGIPFILVDKKGTVAPVNAENIAAINAPMAGAECVGCGRVSQATPAEILLKMEPGDKEGRQYIEQDKYWVGSAYPGAYTTGLATCAALQVEVGGKQLLAHVSAETDLTEIQSALRRLLEEEKGHRLSVRVWTGQGGSLEDPVKFTEPSKVAFGKIRELLEMFGIDWKDITEYPVCFAATVPM